MIHYWNQQRCPPHQTVIIFISNVVAFNDGAGNKKSCQSLRIMESMCNHICTHYMQTYSSECWQCFKKFLKTHVALMMFNFFVLTSLKQILPLYAKRKGNHTKSIRSVQKLFSHPGYLPFVASNCLLLYH